MRGLDAWIESGHYHKTTEKLICETCLHKWEQEVEVEYGGIVSEHECPKCGSPEWDTVAELSAQVEGVL